MYINIYATHVKTSEMLPYSIVSGCCGIARTLQGTGSTRSVAQCIITRIYVYARICQHVCIHIDIYAMTRSMFENDQKRKRLKTCYNVQSCLGVGESQDEMQGVGKRSWLGFTHIYIYIRACVHTIIHASNPT